MKHKKARSGQHINAEAPDREAIMACLEQAGRPLKRRELVAALEVTEADSLEILRRRLRAPMVASACIFASLACQMCVHPR